VRLLLRFSFNLDRSSGLKKFQAAFITCHCHFQNQVVCSVGFLGVELRNKALNLMMQRVKGRWTLGRPFGDPGH